MAPPRKKQKTVHRRAAVGPIPQFTPQRASERLPNEILQTIFEYLSFYDLIRCTQVCKTWARCLPGDYSELHKALFLRGDQSTCTEGTPLRLHFHYEISGHVMRSPRALPDLSYHLEERGVKFAVGTSTHVNPLISRHKQLYNIVHPGCKAYWLYLFTSLDHLQSITRDLRNVTDCGTWRDMLVCVPAVTKLGVKFSVGGVGETRTIEDRRGVRMQSLVLLIRAFLQEMGDVIKEEAPKAKIWNFGYKPTNQRIGGPGSREYRYIGYNGGF